MMTPRKILFTALVFVYAGLCPWLIYQTLKVFNAGLAVIETYPSDAVITINGNVIERKTPITLPNLPTGTHQLHIQKTGYQDHSQNLRIRKGEATVLENILLIPESPTMTYLGKTEYDKLIPIQDTPFLIVLNTSKDAEASVVRTSDKTDYPLFLDTISKDPLKIERVYTIPGSSVVVVKMRQLNETFFFRIAVDENPCKVQNITKLVAKDSREILWAADRPDLLFVFREDSVELANIQEKSKIENFAIGWVGLGLGGGMVYGVDENGHFFVKDYSGKMLDIETTEFDFKKSFFGGSDFVRIWPLSPDSVLLHEQGGVLFQSELPNVLSDKKIVGLRISGDTGDVLVWTDQSLGIRKAVDTPERKRMFTEGQKIEWLWEGDSSISNPTFVLKGSQVLFAQNGKIWLYALNDSSAIPREVMRLRTGTLFHYVEAEGSIYALDPDRGRLGFFKLFTVENEKPDVLALLPPLKGVR